MRHLITTDVHGQYDDFMISLNNARYEETTDRLILLGDVIDRGRQTKEVLEFLAGLISRGRDVVLIRGNHEDILQAFLQGKITALRSWMDTCQGVTLLRSYGYDPSRLALAGDRVFAHGREIRTHDQARAYLLTVMPEAHLAVLEGMRVYRLFIPGGLWGRDVFLCHAGLVHRTPTRETPQWMFAWGDLAWQNGRSTDFQPIAIYGHWHQPLRPLVRFKRICLAMDFSVAVMVLEEMVIVTSDGTALKYGPRMCWVNKNRSDVTGAAYTGGRQRAYPLRHQVRGGSSTISTGALQHTGAYLPNVTAILVALGNALMAEGLCQLLQLHGYRCWVGKRQAEPHAIIVDSATIGKASSLGYPRAKILFLQMEQDPRRVAALLSWHRAHAIIPPSSGLDGFKRALQAVDGERHRAWSRALAETEVPIPFTPREKKVIACICRGDVAKEIAQGLHISPHTLKVHVHNILVKTGAPNRASLVSLLIACTRGEDHEQRSS